MGFVGEMIIPKGIVSLLVIIINSYHHIIHLIDFLIVHKKNTYNCIIDHSYMTASQFVISLYYLSIKVFTPTEIITNKGY